jgi:hypothetical protein
VTIFAGPFAFPIATDPVDLRVVLLSFAASSNHARNTNTRVIKEADQITGILTVHINLQQF